MIWLVCYLVMAFLTYGILVCSTESPTVSVLDALLAIFWPVLWTIFILLGVYGLVCLALDKLCKEENRNA